MCLYIGMGFTALKNLFLSILVCDLAPEDSQTPFIGKNIFVFKVLFVGTLNLCLRMPESEQKTEIQSNHPGLGKLKKTAWTFSQHRIVGMSFGLLLCVRHLETQV